MLVPNMTGLSYAHTIDSVGPYRVEIGWMNEPVVSNETNGIELYVSPLEPGLELEEQVFKDGIAGLEDTIKVDLFYKTEKITLPISIDHNMPGKYYAFVNPTVSGFYQANILGTIEQTPISLSMHPPKVNERAYIEFPEPADISITQMIEESTTLIEDINRLKVEVTSLEKTVEQLSIGYVGIGLGVIGIIMAAVALVRTKK